MILLQQSYSTFYSIACIHCIHCDIYAIIHCAEQVVYTVYQTTKSNTHGDETNEKQTGSKTTTRCPSTLQQHTP